MWSFLNKLLVCSFIWINYLKSSIDFRSFYTQNTVKILVSKLMHKWDNEKQLYAEKSSRLLLFPFKKAKMCLDCYDMKLHQQASFTSVQSNRSVEFRLFTCENLKKQTADLNYKNAWMWLWQELKEKLLKQAHFLCFLWNIPRKIQSSKNIHLQCEYWLNKKKL